MIRSTLALVLVLGVAEARAQNVAGTYLIEFDMQLRMGGGGGGAVSSEKAQVKLVLDVKGDSILGSWAMQPSSSANVTVRPREVRGTVQGNAIKFSMAGQARLNMNGNQQTVETITTYNATITGDEIKGTIDSQAVDGSFQAPQRSFVGKREKS
jgi:hypothetical protein